MLILDNFRFVSKNMLGSNHFQLGGSSLNHQLLGVNVNSGPLRPWGYAMASRMAKNHGIAQRANVTLEVVQEAGTSYVVFWK